MKKGLLVLILFMAFGLLLIGCNEEEVVPTIPALQMDTSYVTRVGETADITPMVVGLAEEQQATVVYTNDNTEVVSLSIDANNKATVTALMVGTAQIKVSLEEFPDVYSFVNIKVTEAQKDLDSFAPTTVVILGQDYITLGKTVKFNCQIIPNGKYTGVIWESTDPSVASVDAQGNVTGIKAGQATIKVTSAIKNTVKDDFVVTVVEEGTDQDIAQRAANYILGELPEYVSADFDLPVYANPDLTVTWKDASNTVITDGKYHFTATQDTKEAISITVEYGSATIEKSYVLKAVVDPENNNFEKAQAIKEYFDLYFSQFDGQKVNGNLALLSSLNGVSIAWTSENKVVFANDGTYVKPNNDTDVTLSAIFTSGSIDVLSNYTVKAAGYTADEKVAYMFSDGVFSSLHNKDVKTSINLPATDSKFGAALSWVSDKPEILDNTGKYANPNLDQATVVNYTVTIDYTVSGYEFQRDVTVTVNVLPLDDVGRALLAFQDSNTQILDHVAYGAGGVPSQITGLPTTIEGVDGVTITWYGKEGEFDSEMNVTAQYLLYHPTEIYAKFSKAGCDDAVLTFNVNIGIMASPDDFGFTARTTAYTGNNLPTDGMPAADNGTGTVFKLGFGELYFKAHFAFPVGDTSVEKDFYFFTAKGNYLEWTSAAVTANGDKNYIDATKDEAKLAALWGSCARVWKNTTDTTVYVNLADVSTMGGQAASDAYKVFAIDAQGNVTTSITSIIAPAEGVTEVAVPAGGYLINPAYLDKYNLEPFGNTAINTKIEVYSFTEYVAPAA